VSNVRVDQGCKDRISQGDIFRDVECVEYVSEVKGVLEVSKIIFPLIIVLTQDCDLQQDSPYRKLPEIGREQETTQDKQLFSVLVAPLYNAEQVFRGEHLSDLKLKMEPINKTKTPGKTLMQNERPRYHYFDFPHDVPVVPSIVDFKHYFSVSVNYLLGIRSRFVCRVSELFREDLSCRFAGYLARIGLPENGAHAGAPPLP
jgi:hypothetical protein